MIDNSFLHRLLGGMPPAIFLKRYWQRRPLYIQNALDPKDLQLTRDELFDLASSSEVESRLVQNSRGRWQLSHGPFQQLPAAKKDWTLLVQGVNWHHDGAHALLQKFRFLPQARLDDLMHEVHRLGAGGRQRLARGHHLQGILRVGEAGHTLGTTGAGEDADLDFRQRDLDRLGIGGHAAMAGERQLGRATHAGAVDGGDPGLAVGLDLAPEPGHAAGGVEELLDGGGRVLGLFLFEHGEHAPDHGEIGTAGEALLARGDDAITWLPDSAYLSQLHAARA